MFEFRSPTKKLFSEVVALNIVEFGLEDTCHSLAGLLLCFSSLSDVTFEEYANELGNIKITHYEDPFWIDSTH